MAVRIGTFDELLGMTAAGLRPVASALRRLVFDVHPDAVEVVRLGDRAATYGLGPRKMIDGYAYVLPYGEWVDLGFYQGVDLADPHGRLEGTGARMRHVKVRSVEAATDPALRDLVVAAVAERQLAQR